MTCVSNTDEDGALNYFTCTLGEAARLPPSPFSTINELIDYNAETYGSRLAVGFADGKSADPTSKEWSCIYFTFAKVKANVDALARRAGEHKFQSPQVALLASSGIGFLWNWLALIRLGYTVLLIAPELPASSIAYLCTEAEIVALIYDRKHETLAKEVHDILGLDLEIRELLDIDKVPIPDDSDICKPHWKRECSDTAYIHHTSGSSTGKPKPIPISHHGAVSVLPSIVPPSNIRMATFTTTPLYHGGPADLFRAWASSAMIWLYPGVQDRPITAKNILSSLDAIGRLLMDYTHYETISKTPLRYFTSVPYILQMLAQDSRGIQYLRKMAIVGFGGAALSSQSGDELVEQGINLVTRYGSAECGFMLCSRRDYANDKAWNYIRDYESPSLAFEPYGDVGLAQVVVKDWPFMAKKNREDGAFCTADLFERHLSTAGAWKYSSRADAQLTLISGLKFDPAPIESDIMASLRKDNSITDVFIFGSGKLFPGLFAFQSFHIEKDASDEKHKAMLQEVVMRVNQSLPPYARVPDHMLKILPQGSPGLTKSNKGVVLRPQSEKDLSILIEEMYAGKVESHLGKSESPSSYAETEKAISSIMNSVIPTKFKSMPDEENGQPAHSVTTVDLFDLGVDSMECMQLRSALVAKFGHLGDIPLNIVYDCGNIASIASFIYGLQDGKTDQTRVDQHELMQNLVKEYGCHSGLKPAENAAIEAPSAPDGEVIIITGVTGTLGAHILDICRNSHGIAQIHCLIRATDRYAAEQRVAKSLAKKHLQPIANSLARVHCWPCKISDKESLGLEKTTFDQLHKQTTIIIHAAWEVNFSLPLSAFVKTQVRGLKNLLDFAYTAPRATPPKFLFCSSTASVCVPTATSTPIPETISTDPATSSPIGYSRSKWVAEGICADYHEHTTLQNRIAVLRIGQLTGDTIHGIWNVTEAWPLMFASTTVTKCFPDLGNEVLDWLKVDIAARAVVEIALEKSLPSLTVSKLEKEPPCPVYHILNPNTRPIWTDLISWLRRHDPSIRIVSPQEWLEKLENLKGTASNHPARKLLALWKNAYGTQNQDSTKDAGGAQSKVAFAMEKTKQVAHSMRDIQPLDEAFWKKVWDWVEHENL